jgi:hypothetical protein
VSGLRARRTVSPLLAALLLLPAAGCTGGSEGSGDATAGPTRSSEAARPRPSVPLRVRVTHVAGRLAARDRQAVATRVGRTVSGYLDDAFLSGDYPRTDFDDSFAAFTSGAAKRARADAGLLTNRPYGSTTRSVRATRRTASLSVLAAGARAVGVTARIDVVLVVDRGDRPARRSRLTGRLMLTPRGARQWTIFGYDLARSDTPAGGTR